jgi:glycosyltransferase involved in cell wall biosynthesis
VEERIRRRVRDDGLDFVVLAGFQRAEALYYRLFDLFVLATRTAEPYATSVVQAMLAGTPVIATATGGTPELVRDGDTGLLVPPRSPHAMAEAILRLDNEPALRQRLIDAARAEVLAHNTEGKVTTQAQAVYDDVLSIRC